MTQAPNTPEKDACTVAFFDFDGTLTTGDTLMPFLKYVVGAPTYYAKLVLLSPVLAAYFVKLLRNDIAKQIVLKSYLAGYHIDKLFELGQRFSEEIIPTMLRPEGMERLRWHQEQGHECVLVSASLDVYLRTWAKSERFSELICTSLKIDDYSKVVGDIEGTNCYGKEKMKRLCKTNFNIRSRFSYAYGDTKGDLPMISLVDKGFLFNGSSFLRFKK